MPRHGRQRCARTSLLFVCPCSPPPLGLLLSTLCLTAPGCRSRPPARLQLNIFVGVGILSLPYGLRESGWLGLGGLFALSTLFCTSGLIIVEAFRFLPSQASKTLPALGRAAGGRLGESLVTFFILCELLGGSCLQTLVLWSELQTVLEALGWPTGNHGAALSLSTEHASNPFVSTGLTAWAPAELGGWGSAAWTGAVLNASDVSLIGPNSSLAVVDAPVGLAARLLPSSSAASVIIATCVLTPLVSLGSFEILSYFSAGGAVATASIVGLLVGLPLLDPHRSKLTSLATAGTSLSSSSLGSVAARSLSSIHASVASSSSSSMFSMLLSPAPAPAPSPYVAAPSHHLISSGLLRALGLFSMALSGHSTLPALRSAMRRPQTFPVTLVTGFTVMAAAYAIAAGTGYWYYGDEVTAVVATDLAQRGVYVEHPGVPVILAALIASACVGRVASLLLIAQSAMLDAVTAARGARGRRPVQPRVAVLRAFRLALFTAMMLVALMARRQIGQLVGLLGSFCSLTLGLVVPVTCYLLLAWDTLTRLGRAGLGVLGTLAAIGVVVGTVQNVQAMLK